MFQARKCLAEIMPACLFGVWVSSLFQVIQGSSLPQDGTQTGSEIRGSLSGSFPNKGRSLWLIMETTRWMISDSDSWSTKSCVLGEVPRQFPTTVPENVPDCPNPPVSFDLQSHPSEPSQAPLRSVSPRPAIDCGTGIGICKCTLLRLQ